MGTDLVQNAVDMTRRALLLSLELSLPILLVGMIVGFLISVVQALTQIQEQTLSFIPKVLAVAATLLLTLPWVLNALVDYMREILVAMRSPLVP